MDASEVGQMMTSAELPRRLQVLVGKTINLALIERDKRHRNGEPGGQLTDAEIYVSILELFGLDCPHPPPLTGYGRHGDDPRPPKRLGECRMCGSYIVRIAE